jgi:diguanylate cyclase (GGDEF)-like protein
MSQYVAGRDSQRQPRALLVSSHQPTREAFELELAVRGCAIAHCADAQSAYAALQKEAFALIVADRRLPDADGVQFCRDLRNLPGGMYGATIVVSNHEDAQEPPHAMSGVDAHLVWPAAREAVCAMLDQGERALRRRLVERKARMARQASTERFLVLHANGAIRSAGPIAQRLLGFPAEALAGVNGFSFFHADDAPHLLSIVAEALTTPGQTRPIEVRVRREGDAWRIVALSATNLLGDPATQGIALDLRGPEARVGAGDHVGRATLHDRVTDLPNRALFHDRVDHALSRAARRGGPVIVLSIDFNGFAASDGPARQDASDELVIAVGQRLRSCLRMSDTCARLGRDDFGVLLEDVADIGSVAVVAERIIQSMLVPFREDGGEVQLTPNIGVSVSAPDRSRAADVIRDASIARAWARVQGSGRHVMYDPSMTPPDDEPTTDELGRDDLARAAALVAIPPTSVSGQLTSLEDRLTVLEQALSRLDRQPATSGVL